MILIECAWCDADLALDGLDATSVECPDCGVTIDLATEPGTAALAA